MNLTEHQLAWYEKHRPVMKAFVEGEEIETRHVPSRGRPGQWISTKDPAWLHQNEYRIKPEAPREFYIHRADAKAGEFAHLYPITDHRAAHSPEYFIKFREVIDE